MLGNNWHASPRKGTEPTGDASTGEIRVPLDIYSLDRPQGPVDLVLSSREAEQLYARLSYLLSRASLTAQHAGKAL